MVHFKTESKPLKHASNTPSPTDLQKDIIPTEDHEQMMLVQWFRRTYPDICIFAIPSGGHRHIAVAAKMKATGTVKGIPDLFVPAKGLWIEMKRVKGGTLSPEQKAMIQYLEEVGYRAIVCKGAEDAKAKISAFFETRNTP